MTSQLDDPDFNKIASLLAELYLNV